MKKIAVLFDLDGTLLNTLEDLCDAVNYTMKKFSSTERSLSEIRDFLGYGAADLIAKSIRGGKENPDYERALAFFKEHYASHADIKTAPYDGVCDLLLHLRERGFVCAVVTNKPDEASRLLCEKHFEGLLSDSIGDCEGMRRKPYPDKVFEMMKRLGCDDAIFVGDAETDILTAKNAEIPCIAVTWGFRDRDVLEGVGGKLFCDKASELEAEIIRLAEEMGG